VRAHAHRGIEREAAVLPGEHLADNVRLDHPAAAKPAQHPHAHLLGYGGDGLGCQFSGGAKTHGLRVIIGLIGRLEDPVDDAAMTNPPGSGFGRPPGRAQRENPDGSRHDAHGG
jgi:hypothetical protein